MHRTQVGSIAQSLEKVEEDVLLDQINKSVSSEAEDMPLSSYCTD